MQELTICLTVYTLQFSSTDVNVFRIILPLACRAESSVGGAGGAAPSEQQIVVSFTLLYINFTDFSPVFT